MKRETLGTLFVIALFFGSLYGFYHFSTKFLASLSRYSQLKHEQREREIEAVEMLRMELERNTENLIYARGETYTPVTIPSDCIEDVN